MNFLEALQSRVLLLDGAMGTMLQAAGLLPGELPERMNLSAPEKVLQVHLQYLQAGCDIVETNTFGANRLKFGAEVPRLFSAGVAIAREAIARSGRDAFVAASIGPSGKLLKPLGDLDFEEAYQLFYEAASAASDAGADLILFETFSDAYEVKAALLAAREATNLPVAITMTFDESGRLLTGADVQCAAVLAESLGATIVGMNCGLGPKQMQKLLPALRASVRVPICINANAGLPVVVNGQTEFRVGPQEFAEDALLLAQGGAQLVGGCCGTTPEHIRALRRLLEGMRPVPFSSEPQTIVTSGCKSVVFSSRPVIIGERLNPTGKPSLKRALSSGDFAYVLGEGVKQAEAGADILDVNVGIPGIDEPATMVRAIRQLQEILPIPLQIDTSNPEAMDRAARIYNGRPLINSVNGKREVMDQVFPIAQKYGAVLIALTLDETGIPSTASGRVAIAERILREAEKYGIGRERLIFDPLALSVSTGGGAMATLDALWEIRTRLGAHTSLGVSNISFGLPARQRLNAAFFSAALARGLSAGIVNPLDAALMDALACHNALSGADADCSEYILRFADRQPAPAKPQHVRMTLREAVIRGLREEAGQLARELLSSRDAMRLVDEDLVPALNEVGKGFEQKKVFLPQLLMSAEAAKAAFGEIRAHLAKAGESETPRGTIVLATVKGDIHDIGKNIVRALLENYGYRVIDLGKDVSPEEVVRAVIESQAPLVGLSALMTTTVESMEKTIQQLRKSVPVKIMVGGAVLTQEYSQAIGADFYARDAMESVQYANSVFGF